MSLTEATHTVETKLVRLLQERFGVDHKLYEYTNNTQANLRRPLFVLFNNFDANNEESTEQLDHFQEMSLDYSAEITFAVGDMSALNIFLKKDYEENKYDKSIKIYGEDVYGKYGFPNDNYTLWRKFCEKLRSGQMWQGVVLNDEDPKPRNLYSIMAEAGDKDVFALFYDPQCPNNQQDRNVLKELAHQLAEEQIVIVTFNINDNTWGLNYVYIEYIVECYLICYDVPSDLPCYPSFFLLDKKGVTNIYYCSPERTLDSFRNFIAKNSTFELSDYNRDGTKKVL